ncbi:hypothetical protein T190_00295 [Sinorhizobium meliloti CCBAU 01290]|nr:hypothetical protein T190_00295 [Sinorhizobium meliloti CCBAU 01290]
MCHLFRDLEVSNVEAVLPQLRMENRCALFLE